MTEQRVTLEDQLKAAIEAQQFNALEVMGFQSDFKLAIFFGAALGYKLALQHLEALDKAGRGETSPTPQVCPHGISLDNDCLTCEIAQGYTE